MTESPHPQPIDFTPVPGRARHDGWTPDRQRRFIAALADTGTVTAAARTIGMSAKSAYRLLDRAGPESGFARAWHAALDRGYHEALAVALRDALEGTRVPVFYGGRQVGEYRRHDTRLALAALNAAAARQAPRPIDPRDPIDRLTLALSAIASSEFPAESCDH